MIRALKLVASACLAAVWICMGVTNAGAARPTVRSRLLTVADLPTGWTITHTSGGSALRNPCLSTFRKPLRHTQRASVSFVDGTTTFLGEDLATGRGELARLHTLNRALNRCHGATVSEHGKTLHLSVDKMSFPKVSRTSLAVTMRAHMTGFSVGFDVVTFRAGGYEGLLAYGTIGSPSATTALGFVKNAIAKALGKSAPKRSAPAPASVGATQSVTSETGIPYAIQLVQIEDPASPATPTFTTPGTGDRFVATEFTITDKGAKPLSDDANSDTTLVGSNDQSYRPGFASIAGCTNFNSGEFTLQPGQSATGCVSFTVPTGVSVTKVEWSPSGGFTSSFVEWTP